jgi:hypothetical protein
MRGSDGRWPFSVSISRSKTTDNLEVSFTRIGVPYLAEKSTLSLGKFDLLTALFVIVPRAVNPRAHRIAPHLPGIAGFQQVGYGFDLCHARIEPQNIPI